MLENPPGFPSLDEIEQAEKERLAAEKEAAVRFADRVAPGVLSEIARKMRLGYTEFEIKVRVKTDAGMRKLVEVVQKELTELWDVQYWAGTRGKVQSFIVSLSYWGRNKRRGECDCWRCYGKTEEDKAEKREEEAIEDNE